MTLDLTDPAAIRAEAERRAKLRAEGLPLSTPVPPPPPDARKVAALEKHVQNEVRKRFIACGGRVYWLSQARASKQTPGLGDLFVFFPRAELALWWETKGEEGKLRPAQVEFRDLCIATHVNHGVGGVHEAETWLVEHGLAVWGAGGLEPLRREG